MQDLEKVNSIRLYSLWKNLTVGLLTVIAMMTFSKLLLYYLSPAISLVGAAFLYTYIFESRTRHDTSCMVIPYALLYSLVGYSFVTILLNVMYAWGIHTFPHEFVFFTNPFIPSLIFNPICFLVVLIIDLRRKKLSICRECRVTISSVNGSGSLSGLFKYESHFQLKNLIILFGILSVVVWSYYLIFYVNININARDWYIFTWMNIIAFILDEVYFIARYYNLYLDLQENNELITPEELKDMSAKTYLRYYVICGNNIYVDKHTIDPKVPYKEIIDTPFFTKRTVNGIGIDEIKRIIHRMTGQEGDLRFFFGGKSLDITNRSILRYFYFLDGNIDDYGELPTKGEWMDFDEIKFLFSTNRGRLARIAVSDMSRLTTIMLTEKTFDERGYRKSQIRNYRPSFNLIDVRRSDLDFQDDKWLNISLFNSDTPFYGFKRWWRNLLSSRKKNKNSWR